MSDTIRDKLDRFETQGERLAFLSGATCGEKHQFGLSDILAEVDKELNALSEQAKNEDQS